MNNPFQITYNDQQDVELIALAKEGSKSALEMLVKKHQHFIYNVALKMALSPFDAEDVTQEVLVKMITHLSQFKGESNFRTWLYRITFNHFLKMKKMWLEEYITTFDNYGKELDSMQDQTLTETEQFELKEYVEDAKIGCYEWYVIVLGQRATFGVCIGRNFWD